MIRFAVSLDLPQLLALWQEAFGDSREETAYYFENRHRDKNMLVYEEEGAILGMLSLLPLTLSFKGKAAPARYIFAVATKMTARGRGISSRLLDAAHEFASKEGCIACLLVPAEESLFAYYWKRGYETAFHIKEAAFTARELTTTPINTNITPCTARDYLAFRDLFFQGSSMYARWDETALGFIGSSAFHSGGGMFMMTGPDWSGAALCEPRGELIRVNELIAPDEHMLDAMAMIHQQFHAERYLLRLPAIAKNPGIETAFGMIHWLQNNKPLLNGTAPYLAFAKD